MGRLGAGTDTRLSNGCRDDGGVAVRLLTGAGSRLLGS
jgi:hypothetical protein